MNLPIRIATRGSALALAQANSVLALCRAKFSELDFEVKIIKTTGDKLQTASLARIDAALPRGLFTKELEDALLDGRADMAVHSLKDLPTELPDGLQLGGVGGKRQDVRDVLIYKNDFKPRPSLKEFPRGITIATSSTRRAAQLRALRPDFEIVPMRGNIATRLKKLNGQLDLDATVLAAAGLARLKIKITASGELAGEGIPFGLQAVVLDVNEMFPCVGQAIIGIEIRQNDKRLEKICRRLNHTDTLRCALAERALLRAIGGGCQAPIGAHAEVRDKKIHLKAICFTGKKAKRARGTGNLDTPEELGFRVAQKLK